MKIKQILIKGLALPKKHTPVRAVKSLASISFFTDGNLFIESFDSLNKAGSMQNRNFRAKAIVNLAMSIECSLKSLVISLSSDSESPIDAYKMAKGLSHKLSELHAEVEKRASRRFKLINKDTNLYSQLKRLKVSSRYSFEVWLMTTQASIKNFSLEDVISRTIDDNLWVSQLRSVAVELNSLAKRCHSKYLAKHSILSGVNIENYDAELKKLIAALK